MKRSIATLSVVAALSAMLGLSACGGGGGGGDSAPSNPPKAAGAAALVKTDTTVGTGAEAAASSVVAVNYTLWLYDPAATGSKGKLIEGPAALTRPLAGLIDGWKQGVPGMKVGGKRTLVVPSSLGYGNQAAGQIPAGSGLVFDIELTGTQAVSDAAALVKTDTVTGTGAQVAEGKTVNATYTMWLYDSTKTDFKGLKLAGPVTNNFTLTNAAIIPGWVQGVPGMKVGGKRTLIVPAVLAYGVNGDGGSVPANSGLVFDVEVHSTN